LGGTELVIRVNGRSDGTGSGRYTGAEEIAEAKRLIIEAVNGMKFEDHLPPEKPGGF